MATDHTANATSEIEPATGGSILDANTNLLGEGCSRYDIQDLFSSILHLSIRSLACVLGIPDWNGDDLTKEQSDNSGRQEEGNDGR